MAEKAVFLDRDGTIIEDPGYLSDPQQVKLLPGATKALKQLRSMNYKLVIATNQSAIARGIITEQTLEKIHEKLRQLLATNGVYLDKIYYCPYHPDGAVPKYRKEQHWRKPNPGMLLAAAEDLDIDLRSSWMVGDSPRDIAAGKRAGCKTIYIESPTTSHEFPAAKDPSQPEPDFKAVNITEVANIIRHQSLTARQQKQQIEPPQKSAPKPASEEQTEEEKTPAPPQNPPDEKIAETDEKTQPKPEQSINRPERKTSAKKISDAIEQKLNEVPEMPDSDRTEQLLQQILEQLKSNQRQDMFEEFSIMRLFAGIAQIAVLFCLLLSILLLLSPDRQADSVFLTLAYAVVLQLMALTFFMMKEK